MARFRAGALRVGMDAPCRWDGAKHDQLHDHECAYFVPLAAAPRLSLGKLAQFTQNSFHLLNSNKLLQRYQHVTHSATRVLNSSLPSAYTNANRRMHAQVAVEWRQLSEPLDNVFWVHLMGKKKCWLLHIHTLWVALIRLSPTPMCNDQVGLFGKAKKKVSF